MAKTLFDHLNAIYADQRVDYFESLSEVDKKSFSPYMIILGVSMTPNYVLFANAVNAQWEYLSPRMVYLAFSQFLPKRKQYSKWIKGKRESKYEGWVVELVARYYNCSTLDAHRYCELYYQTDAGRAALRAVLDAFAIDPKQLKRAKV